jgi:hypothetical protein
VPVVDVELLVEVDVEPPLEVDVEPPLDDVEPPVVDVEPPVVDVEPLCELPVPEPPGLEVVADVAPPLLP